MNEPVSKTTEVIGRLDDFTMAYIEAMLWSSTVAPFGECSSCGEDKVLCQLATDDPDVVDGVEWTLCTDCGGDPSRNSGEPPADDNYGIDDLAPETLARIVKDCTEFLEQNAEMITGTDCRLNSSGCDKWEQAGYDFWLTRAGHGAGFWDGDWEEPAGSKLTEASNGFGELSLYVGDDGKLYF